MSRTFRSLRSVRSASGTALMADIASTPGSWPSLGAGALVLGKGVAPFRFRAVSRVPAAHRLRPRARRVLRNEHTAAAVGGEGDVPHPPLPAGGL